MTIRSEVADAREKWRLLTLYQKFEQVVVMILTGLIAVVVAMAVWSLTLKILYSIILAETFDPTDYAIFQALFGMVFTIIIALEFKRSLLVVAERHESIVQVRTVVLLAMLAILRKMIILDLGTVSAAVILALSAAILALGVVYWLVRDQDRRLSS